MEETIKLIRRAHEGDREAREKLIMDNTGLVWSIVRHFSGRGCDLEDLYQIGCIGLIKAIDKFDVGFDVKFSTYAVPMIMGEVKRFLRDDGMLKVSRSLKELNIRVQKAREELIWELKREPGVDEIAARLGVSREEVAASMEAGAEIESIYKMIGNPEEQNFCLMDRIPDEHQDQDRLLNHMVLGELLKRLNEKDREIIKRRYFENQTQSQVAAVFHISQVQVSRMEKKILLKLREYLKE